MKLNLALPGGRFCAGLGDCILWSWVSNGPEPISFYAEGANREMLELLGQRLEETPEGAIDPHHCYQAELAERGKRPRVKIWTEALGVECAPQRPKVLIKQRDRMRRRVILCPHTNFAVRQWPTAYWMDLNWELRNRNIDPVWKMAHEDGKLRWAGGPTMGYWALTIRETAELFSSAAVVVGNDSMPAHLAGTMGIPTIALMGPTNSDCVFAHIPDVLPMTAEGMDCVGCHFGRPFRAACDIQCQALMRTSPQDVAKTVQTMIEAMNANPA